MPIRYLSGVNVDSNTLVVDAANDRVGIGTASPGHKLSVFGGDAIFTQYTGTGNGSSLTIVNSTTTSDGTALQASYFGSGGYGPLKFEVGGSERLRITSAGNVGIGTTAPAYKLDVVGAINSSTATTSGTGTLNLGTTAQPTIAGQITGAQSPSYSSTGKLGFSVTTWGVGSDYGLTEVMAIDMRGADSKAPTIWMNPFGGNVGIGTTSPTNTLDVLGSTTIRNSGGGGALNIGTNSGRTEYQYITLGGGTGGTDYGWQVGRSPQTGGVINDGFYIYDIKTNNAPFTIALGGNVGIGATAPVSKLQVNHSAAPSFNANGGANALTLVRTGGSGATGTFGAGLVFSQPYLTDDASIGVGGIYGVKNNGDGTFGGGLAFFAQPNSASNMFEVMRITSAGFVGIGMTAPDYNLDVVGLSRTKRTGVNGASLAGVMVLATDAKTIGDGQSLAFQGHNSSNVDTTYGNIYTTIVSPTASAHSSSMTLRVYNSASGVDALTLANTGAATFSSSVTASSLIKSGGTSAQYLMADGSVSTLTNPVTGTGTTNYVPKFTSASAIGNSQIFDNGTNVGIGTASPASRLHVVGGDAFLGLDWTSANYDGNTPRQFRIASNGDNSGYITQAAYYSASTASTTFFRSYVNAASSGALVFESGAGNFNTNGGIPASYAERLRITSAGNVGIGTTSPGYKLDVQGNAGGITINTNGAIITGTEFITGSGILAASSSGTDVAIKAGVSTLMTLKSGGNVLIGTTTDAGYKLDVSGSARASNIYLNADLPNGWFFNGNYYTKGLVLPYPGNDYGNGVIYLRVHPAATGKIMSFKIRISSTWNWVPAWGYVEATVAFFWTGTAFYDSANGVFTGTFINEATGYAAYTLNIGAPVIENGYVSIPIYSSQSNPIYTLLEMSPDSTPSDVTYSGWSTTTHPGTANQYVQTFLGIGTKTPPIKLYVGTVLTGTNGNGTYASDAIAVNSGESITIGPDRRADWTLDATTATSTTFQSKLNIWSDNEDHITFGGASTHLVSAWESFKIWINNDSADAGTLHLYNTSSKTEFARFTGNGNNWINGGNVGIGTTAPGALLQVGLSNSTSDALLRLGVIYDGSRSSRGGITWHDASNNTGKIYTEYDGTMVSMVFGSLYNSGYNSNQLMIIRGNGNVGIGTTGPLAKLEVNAGVGTPAFNNGIAIVTGNSTFTTGHGGILQFQNEDVITAAIRGVRESGWGSGLALYTHNTSSGNTFGTTVVERMRITEAGNVGIGTTSPGTILHLSTASPELSFTATALNRTSFVGMPDGANFYIKNTTAGNLYISDYNSVYIAYGANSQNVGIGTTGPTEKLHVDGSTLITYNNSFQSTNSVGNKAILARVSPTSGIINYAEYATATNLNGFVIGSDDARVKGNITGDSLEFITNTSTRMTVLSSGNVGINTTTPGSTLHVVGDVLIQTGALGVGVNPNATDGRIDASNDIVAFSTSDKRLKENITPIANALEKVRSLTGVEFDWKEETKSVHGYEGHDVGVIAQDVQAVLPEAVRTNDTGYLSVRYEKMIALLIEANKELANRVEQLEKLIK